ncbi:MAG: metallophosphoesterase [Ignavibacteriaceae bacterium]|nr:metallophosphoesterase [Ignavibacteriaceae bacterium]
MKFLIKYTCLFFIFFSCSEYVFPQTNLEESFSFVFCTDIHVQPERNAVNGFTQAIQSINKLQPDFVITGGDLIMDALGQTFGRADSLYNLYQEVTQKFQMPVYNTMGNHEIYGIYNKSGADKSHPEYGEKMFENRLGKSYYSFEHKGWKFMVLNSIEDTKKNKYIGLVDEKQIEWIKKELTETDSKTPIVISTHIPFMTIFAQKYEGSTAANDSALVVVNSKEVLDLFKGYNLKLVLQGHLHTVEDIYVEGVHFITGGAISAAWWKGSNLGFEEGFLLISIKGDEFDWKYVDYGWEVK